MEMDRLQLIDCLEKYFKYVNENQPARKQQLLDAFETLASQTNLNVSYHRLSLATIMEVATCLQD